MEGCRVPARPISGHLLADHHDRMTLIRTGTDMLKCDGLASAAGDVPLAAYTSLIYRQP